VLPPVVRVTLSVEASALSGGAPRPHGLARGEGSRLQQEQQQPVETVPPYRLRTNWAAGGSAGGEHLTCLAPLESMRVLLIKGV